MTADDGHVVALMTDGTGQYWAECSCGWASGRESYDVEAEWAAEDHRQVVTDPAPAAKRGFEGFMSGLLDLQDDLAAASLWLIQNWSADLPVPSWSAGGIEYDHERPVMTVRAYCSNGAVLDRAAELLGVEMVDDPAPDSRGNRYRRATRRFGRVEVEAYTALAQAGVAA